MRAFIRFFDNRTMGFKLTVIFLSVILIPMLLLAYMSYRVIDSRLIKDSRERLNIGLRSAWTEYYIRADQMRYGMLQVSSMEEIKEAVKRRDGEYLKKMMIRWKQMRPYVDIWAVVDEKGVVIQRLNSDYTGDRLDLNGLTGGAIAIGEPRVSTELLTRDLLKLEGNELNERISVSGDPAPKAGDSKEGVEAALALVVVTPVLDSSNKVTGAIVTGDVLNNDNYVPDTVANKTPGLFTTVSLNGKRVSTNLTDDSGRSAKGTGLPETTVSGIRTGHTLYEELIMPGMTYMAAFQPIRNNKGTIIGSLDVGISKERVWEVQKENQRIIAMMTALGLTVSLMAAFISTYRITRPLKSLKEKIGAFASGDMDARVEVDSAPGTKDEIKTLARTFNTMMDEVRRREQDKEMYLKDTERSNREFARLNDELKKTNEELEVAYEETQSQTEELHAINEELKLLNEDLDRKNAELKKANLTITVEEEELKRAKDKLRLIYDSIRDYILLVDYDLRILEANRYFTEKFGVSESSVIGSQIYSVFGMQTPLNNCSVKRSIDLMAPVELEMAGPDGKVYTWHSFPLLDESDNRKAVVYIKDITEQKLMTRKLLQADKLSSLGELVSGVAHELNNPLTGIMCFSELLLKDVSDSGTKTKLSKINDASHRCKKIIDNLLTFARWNRPEKRYEDLNKIIRQSVELRGYQLNLDNIELKLDLDGSIPRTMCDENQVQQVFLNLLNNARDSIMEKGRGGAITVTSRLSGDRLIVKFEDSGMGMSGDVVNRIFDPFFTTKEVGRGTGLGLSISYGIIHEHGGNIYASSAPGAGATFVVELPVIEKHEADDSGMTGGREGIGADLHAKVKGLKAFILDDESIVLDLLADTLTDAGFVIHKSGSGEEAFKKLKDNDYDLIISDIKMPGVDGKDFYNEVARIRPEALKKILFISGDSMSADTREFLKRTGNPYLEKPFTVDQLKEAVSRLIS